MGRLVSGRSRVIQGAGRTKRSVTWALCSSMATLTTLPAASKIIAVLIPAATLLDLIPFTITRTVGLVHVESDQIAATERQLGAFGMGIVNDQAGAVGATAIPGPGTDCGWSGWFVHQFFAESLLFFSGIAASKFGGNYAFDSRAQRKITAEEDIVFMIENSHATFGLAFGVSLRMLIKAG